jgi:hypothetical protein
LSAASATPLLLLTVHLHKESAQQVIQVATLVLEEHAEQIVRVEIFPEEMSLILVLLPVLFLRAEPVIVRFILLITEACICLAQFLEGLRG